MLVRLDLMSTLTLDSSSFHISERFLFSFISQGRLPHSPPNAYKDVGHKHNCTFGFWIQTKRGGVDGPTFHFTHCNISQLNSKILKHCRLKVTALLSPIICCGSLPIVLYLITHFHSYWWHAFYKDTLGLILQSSSHSAGVTCGAYSVHHTNELQAVFYRFIDVLFQGFSRPLYPAGRVTSCKVQQ